jgi:protein-S-isoprenylcysteine O-methyltransferase Ste14
VYLFSLVFLWLAPTVTWNMLGFNIGASLYLIIGMYFEERKLLREFGVEYERYQKQVPILFPCIRQKH